MLKRCSIQNVFLILGTSKFKTKYTMDYTITINGKDFLLRYAAKYVNFKEAKELENDGWTIPTFAQWDSIRNNYGFQKGFFSVDGKKITMPHTGLTADKGYKYFDFWCAEGTDAFNPFCCGGTTFSIMKEEWHASVVLIKEI